MGKVKLDNYFDSLSLSELEEQSLAFTSESIECYQNNKSKDYDKLESAYNALNLALELSRKAHLNLKQTLVEQKELVHKINSTSEKQKKLELRAVELLYDIQDPIKKEHDPIKKEHDKQFLVHEIIGEVKTPSELLIYGILIDYLTGKDPFPNITKESKPKLGRPRIAIPTEKICYYVLKTSKNKTHKLLNISRKKISEETKSYGIEDYTESMKDTFLSFFEEKYESDFLADNKNFSTK